jgi:photosystem II stability/assembly factor-like uncharacterized protein
MSNTRKTANRPRSGSTTASKDRSRPGSVTARTATAKSARRWWPIAAAAALVVGGIYVATQSGDPGGSDAGAPYVGGDLHSLTAIDGRLYVGGHDGVAMSTNEGRSWEAVSSLEGADAMGWAQTSSGLLVGGHPGLYTSNDNGATFTKATGDSQVGDVHAVGAAGDTVYVASPEAGLLASSDGGATWTSRNDAVGQTFMGTILVDPSDPEHLIAPDMQNGAVTSSDGGRTWTTMGGPGATMFVAWDTSDTQRLIAVGMDGGALSRDGGDTWTELPLPDGTSAATFSEDGTTLYAAALDGDAARVSSSTDDGLTWSEL